MLRAHFHVDVEYPELLYFRLPLPLPYDETIRDPRQFLLPVSRFSTLQLQTVC